MILKIITLKISWFPSFFLERSLHLSGKIIQVTTTRIISQFFVACVAGVERGAFLAPPFPPLFAPATQAKFFGSNFPSR